VSTFDWRESKFDPQKLPSDAVAIIGFAGRFPGGANDPDGLWRVLNSEADSLESVEARWRLAGVNLPAGREDRIYSRRAGLISEIDGFDARFFRIPATEADQMDPQQRLLLETAWHAFEDAGLDPHSLKRSRTGVIVGIANDDYARLQGPSGSPIGPYTGLGLSRAVAAGRLAYLFDLRGPAMQIDTTCSSALVSLHLAARELRDGACDLALAGGVNAMLSPETTLGFCEMKALSPTDRLRAFDDAADGYVRGEGCGLLVLRRLGDALERGERIHGVIRGSAVNHDGRTNGLTAPNPGAQAEVISRALEAAGCAAADIHYVEAHGTGTPLGDLIEANGLGAVYGQREHPLRIGSVKSHLGHLEAAAGAASVIKMLLAFRFGKVPGQANLTVPNRRVAWDRLRLSVSTDPLILMGEGPFRAGVSSFGMSGTNVHMILETPPDWKSPEAVSDPMPIGPLLTVSAHSAESLRQLTALYREQAEAGVSTDDLAKGSQLCRSHLPGFRRAIDLTRPDGWGLGKRDHQVPDHDEEGVVFAFSGQGTQWPGMGEQLYREVPAFQRALDRLARAHLSGGGADLVRACCDTAAEDMLRDPEILQPALVAMALGLSELWGSLGVRPSAVIGHSIGEFPAAVLAGSLSEEAALRLARKRGAALRQYGNSGFLVAVAGSTASIARVAARPPAGTFVAAYNSPRQIVLAADDLSPQDVMAALSADGCRGRLLTAEHPFHSPLLKATADAAAPAFNAEQLGSPTLIWVGTAGRHGHPSPWEDPAYFQHQIVEPVGFEPALRRLIAQGYRRFLEIGPDGALQAAIQTIGGPEVSTAGSLQRGQKPLTTLRASVGDVYEMGVNIDWRNVSSSPSPAIRSELPRYPFERKRHWYPKTSKLGFDLRNPIQEGATASYDVELNVQHQPHLSQHQLGGQTIVAAATWVALLLQVGKQEYGQRSFVIERACFVQPLHIDDPVTVRVFSTRSGEDTLRVQIRGSDTILCEAELILDAEVQPNDLFTLGEAADQFNASAFYSAFLAGGYDLGPVFRGLGSGVVGRRRAQLSFNSKAFSGAPDWGAYEIFPGLLDSAFHALAAIIGGEQSRSTKLLSVPVELRNVRFSGQAFDAASVEAELAADFAAMPEGAGQVDAGRLAIRDADQNVVLSIGQVRLGRLGIDGTRRDASIVQDLKAGPISYWTLDWATWSSHPGEVQDTSRLDATGAPVAILDQCREWIRDRADQPIQLIARLDLAGADGDPLPDTAWRMAQLFALLGARTGPSNVVVVAPRRGSLNLRQDLTEALAALAQCAATEFSNLTIAVAEGGAEMVEELLGAPSGLYRDGDAGWQTCIRREASPLSQAPHDISGSVVLLTGGTGGIGAALTKWLKGLGARTIIAVGRNTARPATLPDGVDYLPCDLSQAHEVRKLFRTLGDQKLIPDVVVHAAGVLCEGVLSGVRPEDLGTALAPKLGAARLLAEHLNLADLRLFLAITTVAGWAGSPGLSAYSVANRALESWVNSLAADGVPAKSVALGLVASGMGRTLDDAQRKGLTRRRLGELTLDELPEVLSMALRTGDRVLAMREVAGAGASVAKPRLPDAATFATILSARLSGLMGGSQPLNSDADLLDLGVDSLLAAELASWVADQYGIEVAVGDVLGGTTLSDLASRLVARGTQGPLSAAPVLEDGVL